MRDDQGISLRAPEADELEALDALCFRSKAHWGYDADFMELCRPVLRVDPDALSENRVQVAEIGGALAGVAQISVERSEAELDLLFVDPEFFGKSVGVALFNWACDTARDQRTAILTIHSDPNAREFYEKMGAKYEGDLPSEVIPDRRLPRLRKNLYAMMRMNIKRGLQS